MEKYESLKVSCWLKQQKPMKRNSKQSKILRRLSFQKILILDQQMNIVFYQIKEIYSKRYQPYRYKQITNYRLLHNNSRSHVQQYKKVKIKFIFHQQLRSVLVLFIHQTASKALLLLVHQFCLGVSPCFVLCSLSKYLSIPEHIHIHKAWTKNNVNLNIIFCDRNTLDIFLHKTLYQREVKN